MLPDLEFAPWTSDFLLTRDAVTAAERVALARRAASGELRHVRRGVYTRHSNPPRYPADRHLELVRATSLVVEGDLVFSHRSAAAIWGLPVIGPWGDRVHVSSRHATGGRSVTGIQRHCTGRPFEIDRVGGLTVSGLAQTALDLARNEQPGSAVAALDAAFRGIPTPRDVSAGVARETLDAMLAELGNCRGSRAAAWAVSFADGLSESPGESLSRVQFDRAGFAAPVLQLRLEDEVGEMFPDFAWPEARIVGEFDGEAKYLRHAPEQGVSTAEALLAEKAREDRLRRLGWRVIRWGWRVARDRAALTRLLSSVGVPRERPHH